MKPCLLKIMFSIMFVAAVLSLGLFVGSTLAKDPPPPLSTVPLPLPDLFVEKITVNNAAAIQLGKALFWDMQVGSDGVTACASCHFQAGADPRVTNQLSPGLNAGDTVFNIPGHPNGTITAADFPFHQRVAPVDEQESAVLRDFLDAFSSQGVFLRVFNDIITGDPVDNCTSIPDEVFNVGGVNVRRVEPRNSPTVINSVFNLDNFWDGRASHLFNGVNPFGAADQAGALFVNDTGTLATELMRLQPASLASQAVGPPLSEFEMSCRGRTFPKVGKKILSLAPLAGQIVHPQDSVLGPLSNFPVKGIDAAYADLIQQAFHPRFWSNTSQIVTFDTAGVPTISAHPGGPLNTDQFTQMEANFSMFFGISVMLYEATLVSDQTKFDSFAAGDTAAFTEQEQLGFDSFVRECAGCHAGTLFTSAVVAPVAAGIPPEVGDVAVTALPEPPIELMAMAQGVAFYDLGFYNISVTPTAEDIGRGGTTPFINPLTGQPFPLSNTEMAKLKLQGLLPPDVALFAADLPPANRAIARSIARLNAQILRAETRILAAEEAGDLALAARLEARIELTAARSAARIQVRIDRLAARLAALDARIETATAAGNARRVAALNRQRQRLIAPALDTLVIRSAVNGAFKVPGLRNVELTGPYFHDGSVATLQQVVEFYTRGGNHPVLNIDDLAPDIEQIGRITGRLDRQAELVAFMLTLTDPRVANESAPFDHPQLVVPHGQVPANGDPSDDILLIVPAVGASGRTAGGFDADAQPVTLLPVGRFLNLDPFAP